MEEDTRAQRSIGRLHHLHALRSSAEFSTALVAVLLGGLACTACDRGNREPAPKPVVPDRSREAAPDTATNPSASAGALFPPEVPLGGSTKPRPKIEPNLLDVVPAKVAVSSAVQNPYDFPEHLLDGRNETAWNGRTGDLVGGWIAFRVPVDAHITRIEMTAGFDRMKGTLDLFSANHRITKVTVTRDGNHVGDFPLDPKMRGLQSIPIDGPGGDYRVTVAEVVPGTKKEWKELTVSELRVVGTPGKARRAANEPIRVTIGSLDQETKPLLEMELTPVTTASKTLEDVCKDFVAATQARLPELRARAQTRDGLVAIAECKPVPMTMPLPKNASYRQVAAFWMFDGLISATTLAVSTPRGYVVTPIEWSRESPFDPGCPSIVRDHTLKSVRVEQGHLVAVLTGNSDTMNDAGQWVSRSVDGAYWCREDGAKLSCKRYMAQYNGDIGSFAISPGGSIRLLGAGRE